MREVGSIPLLTGECRHPEAMTLRGASLRPATYPAVAMLLVHPQEGAILFDTGYDPAFLTATEPFPPDDPRDLLLRVGSADTDRPKRAAP